MKPKFPDEDADGPYFSLPVVRFYLLLLTPSVYKKHVAWIIILDRDERFWCTEEVLHKFLLEY